MTNPVTKNVCDSVGFTSLKNIINFVTCLIKNSVIPLLITLAVASFIWGIIQYFLNADNEEKRKKGKAYILWGLIALFVMVSIWGLVGIFGETFGVKVLIPQLSQ